MAAQEQRICDGCHEQAAVHTTYYGHTGAARDLCLVCFEQLASPEELASAEHSKESIRTGKCQYCGAPAVGSTTFYGAPGVLDDVTNLWCEACRQDLVEFDNRPENKLPEDYDIEDEAEIERRSRQLGERKRREEEFMRQRVKERKAK